MTLKQEQAIAALMSEPTIVKAAQTVGVSDRTLRRWLRDPSFAAEYDAAQLQFRQQSIALLSRLTTAAVATLGTIIRQGSPDSPNSEKASDKVAACRTILEWAFKGAAEIQGRSGTSFVENVLSQEEWVRLFSESMRGGVPRDGGASAAAAMHNGNGHAGSNGHSHTNGEGGVNGNGHA